MAALRDLLATLGYTDVTTYLQSGNVVFSVDQEGDARLTTEIERAILSELGLSVSVLIRTERELKAVIAGNPFKEAAANPTTLHVCFLSRVVDRKRLAELDAAPFAPDDFRLGNREIYLWYPSGAARTKLTNAFWERRLDLRATTRNWNTVTGLLAHMGG